MKSFQRTARVLLICISLTYITTMVFAGGNKETAAKSTETQRQESTDETTTLDLDGFGNSALSYSTLESNNGDLYIFKENVDIPKSAIVAQLNIQDVDENNPHIQSYTIPIKDSMETFEYIISANNNTFYPLVPQIATLTLIDEDSNPIRVSEANFFSNFSFYQEKKSIPYLYRGDPILFGTDFIERVSNTDVVEPDGLRNLTVNLDIGDDVYFNTIYKQSDEKMLVRFIMQVSQAIDKYSHSNSKKHILITGINVNSDFSFQTYQRVLNKAEILKLALLQSNKVLFGNIEVDTDVLLEVRDSEKYDSNLYHNFDQAVIRISDREEAIDKIKKSHINQNKVFYKEASRIIYEKYENIEKTLDIIKNNFITTQKEYLSSEAKLMLSSTQSTLKKSDDLEKQIGKWTNKTTQIARSLKRAKQQLSVLNNSPTSVEDTSLKSVIETMNDNGVRDPTLLNGLVTLQAGYDDTYYRVAEIANTYDKRLQIVGLNRSSNNAYNNMLQEFVILLDYQKALLNEEYNQYLLNNFSVRISEIESKYVAIPTVLKRNMEGDNLSIPILISGIKKADAAIMQFENTIFDVTQLLETKYLESIANAKKIKAQKDNLKNQNLDNEDIKAAARDMEINLGEGINTASKNNVTQKSFDYGMDDMNEITFHPLDRRTYTTYENIHNGMDNIVTVSEQVKLRNSVSTKISNINRATDSIQIHYHIIQANVYPIIHTPDEELMNKSINGKDTLVVAPNITPMVKGQLPTYDEVESLAASQAAMYQPIETNIPAETSIPTETRLIESFDENISAGLMLTSIATKEIKEPIASKKTNILGGSMSDKRTIVAYIQSKRSNPIVDVDKLIGIYIAEAKKENVNSDVAIAQMLYSSKFLTTRNFFTRNNPVGLGGPSRKNWIPYTFPTLQMGVRAHIQHLKAYASSEKITQSIVDPRHKILQESGYIGSSSTIEDVGSNWYGKGDTVASAGIINILGEIKNYRN